MGSYDFVEDRTHDGRKYRMLNVIDEFTHESLAIRVSRRLNSMDVIGVLSDLFILRGVPGHVRSDNGPEFMRRTRKVMTPAGSLFTSENVEGRGYASGCRGNPA
jgi:putative transposase